MPAYTCESSEYLLNLRDKGLRDLPVELVPVTDLGTAYHARTAGESRDYARVLAEAEADLPPILVHRATMTVIDGVHRLSAARLRGDEHIAARFFDGPGDDAALLAVATNVAQGRPLSLDDRTAAAERIFISHPQWADRAVAAVVGLSAGKVAQIRRHVAADAAGPRIGRDGRARPLSAARGREVASELLRDDPGASLRQVAKRAGISPATVADVRDRLRRGDDPVPERHRPPPIEAQAQAQRPRSNVSGGVVPQAELLTIVDSLRRDPSLRFTEAGRSVLRVLEVCAAVAKDPQGLVAALPAHCKEPMSRLADGYADVWRVVAAGLRREGEAVEAGI